MPTGQVQAQSLEVHWCLKENGCMSQQFTMRGQERELTE